MKRLAIILALCALPGAAQAANVSDEPDEDFGVRRQKISEVCTATGIDSYICQMKTDRTEELALDTAKAAMSMCKIDEDYAYLDSEQERKRVTTRCAERRAYIKGRWGI